MKKILFLALAVMLAVACTKNDVEPTGPTGKPLTTTDISGQYDLTSVKNSSDVEQPHNTVVMRLTSTLTGDMVDQTDDIKTPLTWSYANKAVTIKIGGKEYTGPIQVAKSETFVMYVITFKVSEATGEMTYTYKKLDIL